MATENLYEGRPLAPSAFFHQSSFPFFPFFVWGDSCRATHDVNGR